MNAVIVRRVLLSLAPLELATVVLIGMGRDVPPLFRWVVATGVAISLALEVALWLAAFIRSRREGFSPRQAWVAATRHVIGDLVWEFAAAELASVVSLWRLLTRRHGGDTDARAITYHRESAPMFWVMAGLVIIELFVVHLVMPWPVARLVLLALSVYTLFLLAGQFAGWVVNPHLLGTRSITIRHGPRTSIDVPLAQICEVTPELGEVAGMRSTRYEPRDQAHSDDVLRVSHAGRTNIRISLTEPLNGTRLTQGEPVSRLHIQVDDPKQFCQMLRAVLVGLSA